MAVRKVSVQVAPVEMTILASSDTVREHNRFVARVTPELLPAEKRSRSPSGSFGLLLYTMLQDRTKLLVHPVVMEARMLLNTMLHYIVLYCTVMCCSVLLYSHRR